MYLARRQLTDVTSVAIAVVTVGVLVKFKKIPEPFIILVAAIAGFLIKNYL